MKRVFSLIILLVVLFLGFEVIVNFFTKSYVNSYKIYNGDKTYEIEERYDKKLNDKYDIKITIDDKEFYYIVSNSFNKQRKIVKDILVYPNGDDICIYPILKNKKGIYLECNSNNVLYSSLAYGNKDFINTVTEDLKSKNYITDYTPSTVATDNHGTKTYSDNIPEKDGVLWWKYKGIDKFTRNNYNLNYPLTFDKYENNTGMLVGKYYIIPQYVRSNILEKERTSSGTKLQKNLQLGKKNGVFLTNIKLVPDN